jgi:L-serine dehydratase
LSGLVGEEGVLLSKYLTMQRPLSGVGTIRAAGRAMGVAVINASLGKIVAAPTAGSCGILPAVLATAAESLGADDYILLIPALVFTARFLDWYISQRASRKNEDVAS